MAGYAAARRIERIEIRSVFVARSRRPFAGAAADPQPAATVVDLSGREPGEAIRQRVEELRTYVGQLTWYLFDAEGWR